MPYTQKEKKLMASLRRQYGAKKAQQVYHAMLNSKEHDNIFGAKSKQERSKQGLTTMSKRKKGKHKRTKRKKRGR
jgi:hypothetical protein